MADDLDPAAVERAARALYQHDFPDRSWDSLSRGPLGLARDDYRRAARTALAAARDGEPDECAHPGGGDVDESGRCAWHRPAAPTVTTEQVDTAAEVIVQRLIEYTGGIRFVDAVQIRAAMPAAVASLGVEVREP